MTDDLRAERIAQTLRERPDLLARVAGFLLSHGLLDENSHEVAEDVCVATFGPRVPCACGSFVLPGFLCWGCEEWTAPANEAGGKTLRRHPFLDDGRGDCAKCGEGPQAHGER